VTDHPRCRCAQTTADRPTPVRSWINRDGATGPSGLRAHGGPPVAAQRFSLQGMAKTPEGTKYPDRDAQFIYINEQLKAHQDAGAPVISVDANKKGQPGQPPAAGREWRPKGNPVQVGVLGGVPVQGSTRRALPPDDGHGVVD
jgi:hypothetical protein